jgi:hypothetical protein
MANQLEKKDTLTLRSDAQTEREPQETDLGMIIEKLIINKIKQAETPEKLYDRLNELKAKQLDLRVKREKDYKSFENIIMRFKDVLDLAKKNTYLINLTSRLGLREKAVQFLEQMVNKTTDIEIIRSILHKFQTDDEYKNIINFDTWITNMKLGRKPAMPKITQLANSPKEFYSLVYTRIKAICDAEQVKK